MDEHDWLAQRFEEHRTHLRAVAYRMLGSLSEADDAVQDAWVRVSQAGAGEVENLGGWLTTIVARVCLNMLRSWPTSGAKTPSRCISPIPSSPAKEIYSQKKRCCSPTRSVWRFRWCSML